MILKEKYRNKEVFNTMKKLLSLFPSKRYHYSDKVKPFNDCALLIMDRDAMCEDYDAIYQKYCVGKPCEKCIPIIYKEIIKGYNTKKSNR